MKKVNHVLLRGRFVKDDLSSLKVLSLHSGIINFIDEKDQLIISIIKNRKNMTGLSLWLPRFFNDPQGIFQPGHVINFKDLNIRYEKAEIWTGSVPSMIRNRRSIRDQLSFIFNNIQYRNSFLSLLAEESHSVFQERARQILKNQIHYSNNQIEGLELLIGLGRGLTPSGDDFITGALLAESCSSSPVQIEKKAIRKRLIKTTRPGRTLLLLALDQSFPAYLLAFLEEADFEKAVKNASKYGSSSGLDSLAGFYWMNQILEKRKSPYDASSDI